MNFDIIINDEIETLGLITYETKQKGKEKTNGKIRFKRCIRKITSCN